METTREQLKKLHTINRFAKAHTSCGGIINNIDAYVPTPEEEGEYNTPYWIAEDWGNNCPPDWVVVTNEINDGESHDVSSVREYTTDVEGFGKIRIYTYNNNAWGHCDIVMDDDIKSIGEWLAQWDELPEEWLRDYEGRKC